MYAFSSGVVKKKIKWSTCIETIVPITFKLKTFLYISFFLKAYWIFYTDTERYRERERERYGEVNKAKPSFNDSVSLSVCELHGFASHNRCDDVSSLSWSGRVLTCYLRLWLSTSCMLCLSLSLSFFLSSSSSIG